MRRLTVVFLLCSAFIGGRVTAAHSAPVVPEGRRTPRLAVPRLSLQAAVRTVRDLLAAARGLPPVVCGLTAEAAAGWGGNGFDAPAPPLGAETSERVAYFPRGRMSLGEVSLVVDSLSTTDACVREVALRLVGRVNASVVEDRLIARLATSTPLPTREAAAVGLGLVRSRVAVDPLLRLTSHDEVGLRSNAAWALGRIGDKQVAPTIRRMLHDDEEMVRRAAVKALGSLEDAASVPELLRVLRTDPVARVRRVAAWALGQIESREAVDGLVAAMRAERDEDVREMCVWALGEIEAKEAVAPLVDVLRRDASVQVRESAAWALGQIEDGTAVAALGEATGGDADEDVRATAAWAIGQIEPSEAPAGLIRAVRDASADVRTRAAWALSEIKDARAVSAVRDAYRTEKDSKARRAQLRALVRGGGASEELFRELLRSDDAEVREQAVRGMAGRSMDPWPWPMPRPRPFP